MAEAKVFNWFSEYSAKRPDKVDLAHPDLHQPRLTAQQKELIVFVMNEMAVQDPMPETLQRDLLEVAVRSRSPAISALAEIERQIGILEAQDAASHSEDLPTLISEMRRVLEDLGKAIGDQPIKHVNDLLLLLRGLRLIDEIQEINFRYSTLTEQSKLDIMHVHSHLNYNT